MNNDMQSSGLEKMIRRLDAKTRDNILSFAIDFNLEFHKKIYSESKKKQESSLRGRVVDPSLRGGMR